MDIDVFTLMQLQELNDLISLCLQTLQFDLF